jgi:hypothetical protein
MPFAASPPGFPDQGTVMRSPVLRGLTLIAAILVTGLVTGPVMHAPEVTASERASLEVRIRELAERVAALELERGTPSSVPAPFTVVGKDGKPLLQVVDNVAQAGWARVTIGGSAMGHSVVAVSSDGKPGGAGAVLTAEPGGHGVLTIRNAKGDPVVRAAESAAGDGLLVVHDKGNRGLFLVTPSFAAAEWARVTVGAAAGGQSAIMVSQDGKVGGAGVAIQADAGANPGTVTIRGGTGQLLAAMSANDGGVFLVRDAAGKNRSRLDQRGMTFMGPSETVLARLGPHPEQEKDAALTIMNSAGTPVAIMRAAGETGALSVMNSAGKPVAGLLGSGPGGGTVGVATSSGATLAQMSVSDDGRGLVQVYSPRSGSPLAVLTQAADRVGGLVQIYNEKTSVANLTIGGAGAGYLQLSDPSGTPTVEAGTLADGNGTVRAGPTYQCLPVTMSGPISFVPNCIMGGQKK